MVGTYGTTKWTPHGGRRKRVHFEDIPSPGDQMPPTRPLLFKPYQVPIAPTKLRMKSLPSGPLWGTFQITLWHPFTPTCFGRCWPLPSCDRVHLSFSSSTSRQRETEVLKVRPQTSNMSTAWKVLGLSNFCHQRQGALFQTVQWVTQISEAHRKVELITQVSKPNLAM
jgi:hypothetical protein